MREHCTIIRNEFFLFLVMYICSLLGWVSIDLIIYSHERTIIFPQKTSSFFFLSFWEGVVIMLPLISSCSTVLYR